MMKTPLCRLLALVALLVSLTAAHAVPTPKLLVTKDDDTPVVYALDDGSYLSLWTFAFSDHLTDVTLDDAEDLRAGFSGGTVTGFLNPDFTTFSFPQTIDRGRHEGALWVRWVPFPDENLTYSWEYLNRGGITKSGSDSLGATATQPGNPLVQVIPEPGTLALLGLALVALAIARLRLRFPVSDADAL